MHEITVGGGVKEVRKRAAHLKNYMIVMGLFIASVILGIMIFFGCVQSSVGENSRQTMMHNVSRQSEYLRTILDIHYQYLNGIAEEMAKEEDLFSESNLNTLVTIHNKTDLERVALIEADGTAHYDTGDVKNVFHRSYFKEAFNGKQTLSDPVESSVDHEVRVVLGVPVFKDNEVIGVLGGSYNVTALSRMMFDDLFDGAGYSVITDKDGNVITYDRVYTQQEQETIYNNVFEYFDKYQIRTSEIQNVKTDFADGKEGIHEIRFTVGKKPSYYIAYTPLGMNDWMISYIVPVKAAQASYDFIREYEIIFITVFGMLIAAVIFYIVYKNRQEKARLLKRAQRDALTGLYNKKTTEDMIERFLEENGEDSYNGLLIMDVDYFKQVNDTYGHIVGDKVLKSFGRLLAKLFREQDIIGRIGGDEFMVLIRNINDVEIARSRVKKLIEEVRALQIPELAGNGITISVGIAYAPDHGPTFMELYRHADTALYQVKRGGRNGFSVYEKAS